MATGTPNKEAGIERRVSEPVYPKDLLSETTLTLAPPDVKGAWAWVLLTLWNDSTYELAGTYEEIGRLWGCGEGEAKRLCAEIGARNIGDIRESNGRVTLICRRLRRRHNQRQKTKKRVREHRARGSNADVTDEKGASTVSSTFSFSGLRDLNRNDGEAGDFYPVIQDHKYGATTLVYHLTGEDPTDKLTGYYDKALRLIGEKRFRSILATLYGELKADEIRNPAAILATKLNEEMERPRQ